MRPEFQRYLAALMLLLGLAGSYLLIVPRWRKLQEDRAALETTHAKIQETTRSVDLLRTAPKGPPFAHVPATLTESVDFLESLNNVARASGVVITRTEQVREDLSREGEAGAPEEGSKNYLPNGINKATLKLTVEGRYAMMAAFFSRLESYPRLVSITNVDMKTGSVETVSADFTLTRYTTPMATP